MVIGFWNLKNKVEIDVLVSLCNVYDIDIIGFAESEEVDLSEIISLGYTELTKLGLSKVRVLSRFKKKLFEGQHESDRYVCIEYVSPIVGKVLISFCHLCDRKNNGQLSRFGEASRMSADIRSYMDNYSINKSIIIGDFNFNPYEPEMFAASTMNATQDKVFVKKAKRRYKNHNYQFYYNPMWKFLCTADRPFGTYFFHPSNDESTHWNMLDNILICPNMLDLFLENRLEIVKKIDKYELLKRSGIINSDLYSDHLPIKAEFSI